MKTYRDMLENSCLREYNAKMWDKNERVIEKALEAHLNEEGCLKGTLELYISPYVSGIKDWEIESFMRHMYLTLREHGYPVVTVNMPGLKGKKSLSSPYEVQIHFEIEPTPWW